MKKIIIVLMSIVTVISSSEKFDFNKCFHKLDEVRKEQNGLLKVYNQLVKQDDNKILLLKYETKQEHLITEISSSYRACQN
ncbi:MAG: hypothetical protein HRT42_04140 [Campylobacteraceae bacterium]|nr:hypothetical protein [Campylobacteraceae bacterium]